VTERGYEQTTIDDITRRAGLGGATFFRYHRSKEDVTFPDHDRMLEQVATRLQARATAPHRPLFPTRSASGAALRDSSGARD
jgi:AcrR family transcriptional regulator